VPMLIPDSEEQPRPISVLDPFQRFPIWVGVEFMTELSILLKAAELVLAAE
jgi:hypothetical protein